MFNAKPEARKLGWAVVGCGWVARDYVIPALQGARNTRLVALCDSDAEALMRPQADDAARYTQLSSVLEDKAVDAVYIATPNHLHAAMTEACAAAGKHVLCEKPMAVTAQDGLRMVAACQRAGVHYATAFDQRHHAAHRKLRTLVKEGVLGTITQARIHYACWLPADWAPGNWRIDPEQAGGGAMIDLAPHGLDLLEVLLGDEWQSLTAMVQRRVHDYAVDDGAVLMGQFRSGTLGLLQVAYNCPDAYPRRTLELIGTKARALAYKTMGQTPGGSLSLTDAKTGEETWVHLSPEEDRSPFLHQVESFTTCVLEGRPQPFPPERDVRLVGLLGQATHSGRAFPPCH
ncbi:gfo/Idh/MocA family oxidoreductase [Corallococcus praedator]|uniref:Gfo/Idh/MocA family oxidoreductase n=1 Tax=Corallococcus praedator TaxID=2316724 RepID=A0ABX9Q8J8_9BACT|nr:MULTISPECIES: Gfo/Idh/MocA family oxidoreductase [Corallococcus]RKH23663.1 gfo/Idh/MocA family oxidoreductase [Corallococcus sp. CA031C]RKH94197.1 gfo/Idh/MocA family oxidoreductase [Corallococcus praedator]